MKNILLSLLILIVSQTGLTANESSNLFRQYKIRRISPEGGLGINGQRDVRQDKWGFLWVVTVNNLYRFDGYAFKDYTSKLPKPETFSLWSFGRLEINNTGEIFISSNFGLLKYNPIKDNFDYLYQGIVNEIKEDNKGRFWMCNSNKPGIFDLNSLHFTPIYSEYGPIDSVSTISAKKESIYIGTESGKVFEYNENSGLFKLIFEKPDYIIKSITYDDSKIYILTEDKGLFVIDKKDYNKVKHSNFFCIGSDISVPARDLFLDKNNCLWISSQRGIYVLNLENDEYIHYIYDKADNYGLPSNSVWKFSEDNEGNLWFGTYSSGLCLVNLNENKKLKSFNDKTDNLNNPVVSSFEEDEKYLWIGTEGGGLNRYDKKTKKIEYFKNKAGSNSLSYDNIQSLLLTENNKLWIGTSRGGLNCLDTEKGIFTYFNTFNKLLINDHVSRIVAEADSGIWIKYLLNNECISYLSLKDNKIEHINLKSFPSISNISITDIYRGDGDTLWIVSSYQLVIMNVKTKDISFVKYVDSEIPNYQNINIKTIYSDNINDIVWLGTDSHGLLLYNLENQKLIQAADLTKYNTNTVFSINKDNSNNIWIGTNNGLFCIDLNNNRIQQFDKADGAQGRVYYPFSSYKSKSGRLYFGGNEGFTEVDTMDISFNDYKPKVIISDFFIDNVSVVPGIDKSPLKTSIYQTKELILNYFQNNFSFEFSSTNYLNSDRNRFKYRLKNYDDMWIETDARNRRASYAKVPDGKYIFEIITSNNDGIWGEQLSLDILIKPKPWLSTWAYVGYVLLLSLVLYFILRYYNYQKRLKLQFLLEKQEKKQKEEYHKEQIKFFTNVSHDFRTPISLILASLEPVKAGKPVTKYLPVLENNAKRLLTLINELMDFRAVRKNLININLSKGNWNEFINDNIFDFNEYAEQKDILFKADFDSKLTDDVYFDKKIVEKILLNLLNNAFKYTPAKGEIRISTYSDISAYKSSFKNSFIVDKNKSQSKKFGFVISDTGIGISDSISDVFERYYRVNESEGSKHLGSGIGLALVKSLIELHKGYIAIYSERGTGTDIVIGFSSDISIYDFEVSSVQKSNINLSDTIISKEGVVVEKDETENSVADNYIHDDKKKILFVEDNQDLRNLISEFLSERYDVKEASNGEEALDILKEEFIDIIITDIMMPKMDGIELSNKLKKNIETSHIPIIMLTAKISLESKIEGLQTGADVYLEKPVNKNLLLITISNLLKQQSRIKEYYAKRYFANIENQESQINKRDSEFMKKLINLIEDNISDTDIDVLYIASSLAMSRRTLYGKVKALTGQSVVEFIRNYRLRKASQILTEEDVTINEVIFRVGIDSPSYFSRVFKKEFGVTPSEFIANNQKKNNK
jgi:signal transduction histidine kinase/ligand-binding sensor domain-containing protein/DNA-binding response OmpR family regulator